MSRLRIIPNEQVGYGPCATRLGNQPTPSARPWHYDHAASIEGAHWNIYAGDGIDGWLVGMATTEADAALIVTAVNALTASSDEGRYAGSSVESLLSDIGKSDSPDEAERWARAAVDRVRLIHRDSLAEALRDEFEDEVGDMELDLWAVSADHILAALSATEPAADA